MNKFKLKIKIILLLIKYNIRNYELIYDDKNCYLVNVNGDVDLYNKNLKFQLMILTQKSDLKYP